MSANIGVFILGATGYGAGELLRLLHGHPHVEIAQVISSSAAGESVESAHPQLKNLIKLPMSDTLNPALFNKFKKAVIIAGLPHGTSGATLTSLINTGLPDHVRCIDLSGDLRLKEKSIHEQFYAGCEFNAPIREKFIYGLADLDQEKIKTSRYIANPGCLATACILAALPLTHDGFSGAIVFDAKTGTSGAGKTPQAQFHHPLMHANAAAYKVLEHRHEPEIAQALGDTSGKKLRSFFVPHVIPVSRGIFVTAYFDMPSATTQQTIYNCFTTFYKNSPFVRIREDLPQLAHVVGSNFTDIGIRVRGNQVVVMTALDNLVKGMAGQAIQNLNLMCGLEESTGLLSPGLGIF